MDTFPMKTDLIQIKGKPKNGKVKVVKYDRSFLSRIIQNEKAKRFYDEIKNYCMSFERVKARSAWGAESFVVGNETIVKLIYLGGSLCVLAALSPALYSQKDYPHADFSEKREYASTPMLLPVRTNAEVKIARRMIAEAFTTRCIYTLEFPTRADYVASLPAQKDESLIKKKMIKVSESEMSEADAKKAVASALKSEAEEEKILEEIGGTKKRAPKKKPQEEAPVEETLPVIPAQSEEGSEEVIETPAEPAPIAIEEAPIEPAPAEDACDEEGEIEDETNDEDMPDTVFELASDGLVIEVKYDRSFISRIIQNEGAKTYYDEIKNYLISFGLKPRASWKADSFYLGRKTYLVAKVRGKTLTLYYALDPTAYEDRIYHHVDVSGKKTYEKTPMMVKVRSDLGLRKAKKLIDEMMDAAAFSQKETPRVDYVALYPYETTDALIEKKLIKRFERHLDETESVAVLERKEVIEVKKEDTPEDQPEEVVFELREEPIAEPIEEPAEDTIEPAAETADESVEAVEETAAGSEDSIEDVVFELDEGEDEIEDVVFETVDEEDEEDVTFELVEETPSGMESYAKEKTEGKFVTLKKYMRGFTAKMRQGDDERKDYYAEIKAKLLSYKGVKLSESFSGDSYKKGARALMKSRIRGKTLCLFFALNPDNYKQTIYRQQYKGDTKAYASTPMMVRVKSEQGLKRALRLIEEMERNYLLQAGDPVDYVKVRGEYLYEETASLVEKGLIKTRLVTVTEYEAERLLKKKSK